MGSGRYTQAELWQQTAHRWVVHVDMDAFFASIEQHDDPNLAGQPLIVGNSPLPMEKLRELAADSAKTANPPELIKGIRGVVASASYEARAFGVRSAMPLAKALALCPQAHVVAGRFGRYKDVAAHLRRVWAEFSPIVEPASLDEAYLDLTGSELCDGPIVEVGRRLKARIREETGLTASVGIGSSKLISKIASDLRKPDGLVVVPHGEEAATLAPLHVRTLPGVGPRTAEVLLGLGIISIADLQICDEERLVSVFGAEQGMRLQRRAAGIDDTPVQVPGDPKSMSREITLVEDTCDLEELKSRLRVLADRVAWTLRQEGLHARCVYVKLRLLPRKRVYTPDGSGFGRLLTRQRALLIPTAAGQTIYEMGAVLLDGVASSTGLGAKQEVVRLLGIGTSALSQTGAATPNMFTLLEVGETRPVEHSPDQRSEVALPPYPARQQRLDASMDTIRRRYGFGAISLATGVSRPDSDVLKD